MFKIGEPQPHADINRKGLKDNKINSFETLSIIEFAYNFQSVLARDFTTRKGIVSAEWEFILFV